MSSMAGSGSEMARLPCGIRWLASTPSRAWGRDEGALQGSPSRKRRPVSPSWKKPWRGCGHGSKELGDDGVGEMWEEAELA